jgi:hypothetical protein
MALTGTQIGLISFGILLALGLTAFLVWWFVFRGLPDCLVQVKAKCKPGGGDVTCEEYAECVERSDYKPDPCVSTWHLKNCADEKRGPGKGTVDGKTLTWEGPYYKINTQGGGGLQASIPEIDLSKIDTIVLKLDFSDTSKNNSTGSEITFGLSVGMKVSDLLAKYKDINATVSDAKVLESGVPGTTKIGNVSVGDSTLASSNVNFIILTNRDLKNTKQVVTLKFTPK